MLDMNEPQNPPWTPGPWEVDEDYPCNVSTADHRTIAETCDSWFNLEISHANARLIAAAPELVAALESAREFIARIETELGWVVAEQEGEQIDALLARVRGEEIQG